MTRVTARELAILLGFSITASEDFAEESIDRFFEKEHYETLRDENELFAEYPNAKQMRYIRELVQLIYDHRLALDNMIEQHARGWKVSRISRTAAAIIRCAMCEILYLPDVPDAAAINEAVELAKKYEDAETVSFINGVLGGFIRAVKPDEAAAIEAEVAEAAEAVQTEEE